VTRINKYIADRGVASRRSAEDLIRAGKVQVNGETIVDLGRQISETDTVTINGKQINRQPEKVYIMLNKPAGVVTTCDDQFNRKTVLDLVPNNVRLFPVGRLDYATEGLLILTNDGEFAKVLTHPTHQIPKTYVATLSKPISVSQLATLRTGAGFNPPKHVSVKGTSAQITITQGQNRQVRKMFEFVGARVKHLARTQIGGLTLGGIGLGEWRYLTTTEIHLLIPQKKNIVNT
jgi:23S rRNA pseudouridine2605 synthase